jgi:Protein of unknown function (DUF3429)
MVWLAEVERIPRPALWLGLLGAIPFLAGAISQWAALARVGHVPVLAASLLYGAVILSFLGGIRWGTAIGPYGAMRQAWEFTGSIIPAAIGWIALLLPPAAGLSLLIIGFLAQALWDVIAVEDGRLPAWFGTLRMVLTSIAVISLTAILLKIVT